MLQLLLASYGAANVSEELEVDEASYAVVAGVGSGNEFTVLVEAAGKIVREADVEGESGLPGCIPKSDRDGGSTWRDVSRRGESLQQQKKTQVPFGNDRKKGKSKGKGKANSTAMAKEDAGSLRE